MFTNFDFHLGVDKKNLSQECILISDTDIDGNFLLHHFISHYIHKNGKICLLGFAQTLTHYTSACHKIGVNLQTAIAKKQFVFIDALRLLYDGFISSDTDSNNIFSNAVAHDSFSLKPLFDLITINITDDSPTVILLDDICSLVNIGIPVQIIADFVHYCKTLTLQKSISFVFLTHLDEDPDYIVLHSWLKRYATLEIDVKALKSGYSKELSGDMNIVRRDLYQSITIEKRLHFKLLDKDVKFYAPGTSSVVL